MGLAIILDQGKYTVDMPPEFAPYLHHCYCKMASSMFGCYVIKKRSDEYGFFSRSLWSHVEIENGPVGQKEESAFISSTLNADAMSQMHELANLLNAPGAPALKKLLSSGMTWFQKRCLVAGFWHTNQIGGVVLP